MSTQYKDVILAEKQFVLEYRSA